MIRYQTGFALISFLIIACLIAVVLVYFGLTYLKSFKKINSPSSPQISSQSDKVLQENKKQQALFEKHKQTIKDQLNLSEERFQILKRYSVD